MSDELEVPNDMRRLFRKSAAGARPRADCPPSEDIWEAVRGELGSREMQAVLDHLGECGSCAEDWRVAKGVMEEAGLEAPVEEEAADEPAPWQVPAPRRSRAVRAAVDAIPWPGNWGWVGAAFAAGALAIVLLPSGGPIDRSGGSLEEPVRILGGNELSLEDPVLRWEAPEGATCDLRVGDERGTTVLVSRRELTTGAFRLGAETVEALTPGLLLQVQLECELPEVQHASAQTMVEVVP